MFTGEISNIVNQDVIVYSINKDPDLTFTYD